MQLYLDVNAHVSMSKEVIEEMGKASPGNPMAPHSPGRKASQQIEYARNKIAELIGAESSNQIIFTASCSQACEWGCKYFSGIDGNLREPYFESMIVSPLEHSAVRSNFGSEVDYFPIKNDTIDTNANLHAGAICIHSQNETGTIQDINNINADFLFSDMSQSLGKISFNIKNYWIVDIAAFGAHKFGGPVGLGFLYIKDLDNWREFDVGSRYFMDRAGTPDTAAIMGGRKALEIATETLYERQIKMREFHQTIEAGFEELGIDIIGKQANRLDNTTFIHLPEGKGMYMLLMLEREGICVGLGSACGSMNSGVSPVVRSLGYNGKAHDFMRISSWGDYGKKEAKFFLDKFNKYFRV